MERVASVVERRELQVVKYECRVEWNSLVWLAARCLHGRPT